MQNKLFTIQLSAYIPPNPQSLLSHYSKYITNGVNNDYFYDVEEAYLESTTNQAIIDNFSNYIMGEGLKDSAGVIEIDKILDKAEQRLAVTDFKIHGACAFQVIYRLDGTISRMAYIPTKSLAVNKEEDITDEPKGYWYSFDWRLKTRFKPHFYPAFGYGDKLQTEILYIKRPSPQPIFALPDWQSGLKYCIFEGRMKDFLLNYLENNFSGGKIININQGLPDNDDAAEEAERAIRNQLTGSRNAGNFLISYNENKENATTITNIEITDFYNQFQAVSGECIKRIMLAHKVNDPGRFGLPNPSGFSSSAEERIQSLKELYRSQINPSRQILTNGLNRALFQIYPGVNLVFEDFEELRSDQQNNIVQ